MEEEDAKLAAMLQAEDAAAANAAAENQR